MKCSLLRTIHQKVCMYMLHQMTFSMLMLCYFSYESFLTSALSERYPNFKEHLCAVFDKKKMKWCSAYRVGALLRGNHTNNYVESSMRILKDQV